MPLKSFGLLRFKICQEQRASNKQHGYEPDGNWQFKGDYCDIKSAQTPSN